MTFLQKNIGVLQTDFQPSKQIQMGREMQKADLEMDFKYH